MGGFLVHVSERLAIRRAIEVPCCVVRFQDGRILGTRALDLTPYGMRIELRDVDVEHGDLLHVCFRATQLARWFYTDGRAARLLHGRRAREQGRSLGVEFEGLDAISRLLLRGALRRIPPPLPQREQRIDYAATIGRILRAA